MFLVPLLSFSELNALQFCNCGWSATIYIINAIPGLLMKKYWYPSVVTNSVNTCTWFLKLFGTEKNCIFAKYSQIFMPIDLTYLLTSIFRCLFLNMPIGLQLSLDVCEHEEIFWQPNWYFHCLERGRIAFFSELMWKSFGLKSLEHTFFLFFMLKAFSHSWLPLGYRIYLILTDEKKLNSYYPFI